MAHTSKTVYRCDYCGQTDLGKYQISKVRIASLYDKDICCGCLVKLGGFLHTLATKQKESWFRKFF